MTQSPLNALSARLSAGIAAVRRLLRTTHPRRLTRRLNAALFGAVSLNQQLVRQSISRAVFEYNVTWHGHDEIYSPVLSEANPCRQYPNLALHYIAQAIPRQNYFIVPNAIVTNSMVVDPARPRRLFLETYPEPIRLQENLAWEYDPIARRRVVWRKRRAAADFRESYIFSSVWWHNYYYFLTDSCLKFVALDAARPFTDNTTLLFHTSPCGWQKQYLDLLGVTDLPNAIIDRQTYKIEQLLVASPRRSGRACSFDAIQRLRSRMFACLNLKPAAAKRKIYISRKDAPKRRITNEEEIIEVLKRHNFEVFTLSNLPISEQISLFAEADVIVGAHGAGLTNMIYAPRPRVVEILPRDRWNMGAFIAIANSIGGTHTPLVCGDRLAIDPEPFGDNTSNFTVDSRALDRLLGEIGV